MINCKYVFLIGNKQMSDIECLLHTLRNWKEKEPKVVLNVLQALQECQEYSSKIANQALFLMTTFHKDITKEQNIPIEWFNHCKSLKKKLKIVIDKEGKTKQPAKPKSLEIEYPPELTQKKNQNSQKKLKYLYRHFMCHLDEDVDKSAVCGFLNKLLTELRQSFEDRSDGEEVRRIDSICLHFEREGSRAAKMQMLTGELSPKVVAEDDEEIYVDEETKKWIEKIQQENFQAIQTGFYTDMKKNINKNAHQECRMCFSNSAYCEDQKQIRAADQPMTRFMRCNNCGKGWRD